MAFSLSDTAFGAPWVAWQKTSQPSGGFVSAHLHTEVRPARSGPFERAKPANSENEFLTSPFPSPGKNNKILVVS